MLLVPSFTETHFRLPTHLLGRIYLESYQTPLHSALLMRNERKLNGLSHASKVETAVCIKIES
jgi:hypothetical protein